MENINVVLHHGVVGAVIHLVSPRLSIPTSKSEKPAAADDRHLSHGGGHRVPPQDAQITSVVLPFNKREIHNHQEPKFRLRRRGVQSLSSSQQFRPDFRPLRQRIVRHHHRAEQSPRRVGRPRRRSDDQHRRGIPAAEDVVEVEVEVAQLLLPPEAEL